MNKKMILQQYVLLALCALFSVLNIHIVCDISLAAFFTAAFFTAILFYIAVVRLQRHTDAAKIPLLRKLYQYLPFVMLGSFILRRAGRDGVPVVLDAVSVTVWLVTAVLSVMLAWQLDAKRVFLRNPGLKTAFDALPVRKKSPAAKVLCELFDWIDAFVQAAFTVTLINIFIFQLYEIPSESMVPEFLIRDRVVVMKTPSGPQFPLSNVRLPRFRNYARGDIVVFRNPHYAKDRPAEVKTFLSQLVYMLTFTGVNLNVDENGQLKADPLVKRITGVPGEQLMMQDGILYSRTKDSGSFVPVAGETKWAEWNLAGLDSSLRANIQDIPVPAAQYARMLEVEKERNEFDISAAKEEARSLAGRFSRLSRTAPLPDNAAVSGLFSKNDMFEYTLFSQNDSIAWKLLSVAGGNEWFSAFMTEWISSEPAAFASLYDEANFRLNVLIKLCLGRLIVRNAELLQTAVSSSDVLRDQERLSYLKDAEKLNLYVMLLDRRNMPVFPANDSDGNPVYIPAGNYFMMGDNRFNSLDMRHSYTDTLVPLAPADPYSVTYYSNMAPQYVAERDILGSAALRFWPVKRFGIPGFTGRK